jgi:hypothetical protein
MANDNIVKGKTSSGIEFTLDKRIKDDARFLYFLAKVQDESADMGEKSKAIVGLLGLVFGSDEGVLNFMNAVAAVNDGVCGVDQMLHELTEIFDSLDAKN